MAPLLIHPPDDAFHFDPARILLAVRQVLEIHLYRGREIRRP
jgi:hypothetical protein